MSPSWTTRSKLSLGHFGTIVLLLAIQSLGSFCPKKQKINIIKNLTHRELMIYYESQLNDEVEIISGTLWGQLYFYWLIHSLDSFCPKKQKINIIKTLTHRELMIYYESQLNDEVEIISGTLCNNGLLEDIVWSVMRDKFLISVKLNLIQSRGVLYISGCLGLLI